MISDKGAKAKSIAPVVFLLIYAGDEKRKAYRRIAPTLIRPTRPHSLDCGQTFGARNDKAKEASFQFKPSVTLSPPPRRAIALLSLA